jgi:hypothetical protein
VPLIKLKFITMALISTGFVQSPVIKEKLIATGLADGSQHELFRITGAGLFLALKVMMAATNGNFTSITVKIDGNTLINDKFSSYVTFGQTISNPSGAMVTLAPGSNSKALFFGMPYPLAFNQELLVTTTIGGAGVQQINAELMTGL